MIEPVEILAADAAGQYLVTIGGRDQSHVDLDDPTHLAFDYVRRIGDVLDAVGQPGAPLRVVHVGGAGLTLARYVAATRPTSAQIVLEPAVEVTERVRAELPLPRRSGIKVRPVDGASGVRALRDASVDVMVVDAYDEGQVPRDLLTGEHQSEVARVLAPAGLYVLNLADKAPFTLARDVLAGLRAEMGAVMVSAEPATLRGKRVGNLLLVASRTAVPAEALRARAISSASPYRVLDGDLLRDTLGGGTPLTPGGAGG